MRFVYDIEAAGLRKQYLALAVSGVLTPEARRRHESHAVWQQVAPLLGLLYDRIEATA
jgi:hypothetical protein